MPLDNQSVTSSSLSGDPKFENRGIRIARGSSRGKNVSYVQARKISAEEEEDMIMSGLEKFANMPGTNGFSQFASKQSGSQINVDGGFVNEMGLPVRTSSSRGVPDNPELSGFAQHMMSRADANRSDVSEEGFAGAEGLDPSPSDRRDVGGDRSAELEDEATFLKTGPIPEEDEAISRQADGELSEFMSETVDNSDRRDRSYDQNPSVIDGPMDALMDIPSNGSPMSQPPEDFVDFGQPHVPGISQGYPANKVKDTEIIGAKKFTLSDGRFIVGKVQVQSQTSVMIVGKVNGTGPMTKISKLRADILRVEPYRVRTSHTVAKTISEAHGLYKKAKGMGGREAMKTAKGYDCRLVDDGTMDTVVSCNGRTFRFNSDMVERLPDGSIPQEELDRIFDEASEMYEEEKATSPEMAMASRRKASGLPAPDAGFDLGDPVFVVGDKVSPQGNSSDPYFGQEGVITIRDNQISPGDTRNRAPEDILYTVEFPGGGYSEYYYDGLKKVGHRGTPRKAESGFQVGDRVRVFADAQHQIGEWSGTITEINPNGYVLVKSLHYPDSEPIEVGIPWVEKEDGPTNTASRKPATASKMSPDRMSARDTMPDGAFYGSDSAMVDQLNLHEKRKAELEMKVKIAIKEGNVADGMGDTAKAERLSAQAEAMYNLLKKTNATIVSMKVAMASRRTASKSQRFFKDNPPADRGLDNPFLS